MSVGEDDSELKDLVSQALENSGMLHNIRAQLKASVYLALEKQEKRNLPVVNENMRKYLSTNEGCILASLVREFLTFHSMDYATSVFDSESCNNQTYEAVERPKLAGLLGLEADPELPILASLVRKAGLGNISIPGTPGSQNATFIRHNSTLNSPAVSEKSHSRDSSKSMEASESINHQHSTPIKGSDEEKDESTANSTTGKEHQVQAEIHQVDEYNEDFSSVASETPNEQPLEDNRPVNEDKGNDKEEEIEEELEEVSDLLQSSTSLGDDGTRDQTASTISQVGDYAQSL